MQTHVNKILRKEIIRRSNPGNILKDSKISGTFNNYFVNINDKLGMYDWGDILPNCLDSIEKIK